MIIRHPITLVIFFFFLHDVKTDLVFDFFQVQYINLRDQYAGDLWTISFMIGLSQLVYPSSFDFRKLLKVGVITRMI